MRREYRPEHYYWESVISARKLLIVAVVTFLDNSETITQARINSFTYLHEHHRIILASRCTVDRNSLRA
jgi:hypothetical protein